MHESSVCSVDEAGTCVKFIIRMGTMNFVRSYIFRKGVQDWPLLYVADAMKNEMIKLK